MAMVIADEYYFWKLIIIQKMLFHSKQVRPLTNMYLIAFSI